MVIWKLIPVELQDEEWERSIYKGDVIVRAKDEKEAREVANRRFDKAVRNPTRTLYSPWLDPALVQCRCLQLEADGLPAVLAPPDYTARSSTGR